jgi:hypothetical protein
MRLSREITMTNRRRLFALACGLIAMLVSGPRIAAEPAHTPSVRLRVDDYAAVATGLLSQAQEIVTQLYGAIGVETTWLSTRVLSSRPIAVPLSVDSGMPDLTVIVLDPGMTLRMAPPANAMGMAAETENNRGRIAYVFYDRLRMMTLQREASDVAALSLVMAHEIGHLLLPYSSHSDEGVMRGHWDLEGFRHLDIRRLTFTRRQGQLIRHMLGGD